MKKCFKCLVEKPLSEFYAHGEMADGHLNKCKECAKRDAAIRYADPESAERIRDYERKRFKLPSRKEQLKQYARNRRQKHPEKEIARNAVSNALRDKRLERLPCEVCGDPKSQAHHDDYSNPLEVRWLCFVHHRQAHGQNPATG